MRVFTAHRKRREGQFAGMVFPVDIDFSGHEFITNVYFTFAHFAGVAHFQEAKFNGGADFRFAKFTGEANFGYTEFTGGADFGVAQFNGDAFFEEAKFNGKANFGSAEFTEWAIFVHATFTGSADFNDAAFTERANFSDAEFTEWADFSFATFTGAANFSDAEFTGTADFSNAEFTGTGDFSYSEFTGTGDFSYSEFNQHINFDSTTIANGIFERSVVHSEAPFIDTKFLVSCSFRNARFMSRVRFQLTIDSRDQDEPPQSRIFQNCEVDFQSVIFDHPELVEFGSADFSRTLFTNTDISQFKFTSIRWAKMPNYWERWKLKKRKLTPDEYCTIIDKINSNGRRNGLLEELEAITKPATDHKT